MPEDNIIIKVSKHVFFDKEHGKFFLTSDAANDVGNAHMPQPMS